MAITLNSNSFLSTLSNLIAYTMVAPTLKDGIMGELLDAFRYEDVVDGDGIVVRGVDVPAVNNLNIAASSLLTPVTPSATEQYIDVNYFKVIPLTINKYLLRMAFVQETALSDFAGMIITSMEVAKRNDIYTTLIGLINGYAPTATSGVQTVNTFNVASLLDPAQLQMAKTYNTNVIMKQIQKVIYEMGVLSDDYNDANLKEVTDASDLVLLVRSDIDVDFNFDTFAREFNSTEYIKNKEAWAKTLVLPAGSLPTWATNKYVAMLVHRNKFVYGFMYQFSGMFFDISNLNEQNFMHFAYYADKVTALPAVAIKADPTLTPTAL